MEIRVPKPYFTAVTIPYSVNLDSVAMWGVETGLDWTFSPTLTAGAAFSWNRYHILKTSNGVESIALYPDFTASVYAEFSPVPVLSIYPSLRYVGSRFTGTDGGDEMDGYLLVNLKAAYEINSHLNVTAAVDNLFDTLYEIRPYFPQPGRSYTISVTAKY